MLSRTTIRARVTTAAAAFAVAASALASAVPAQAAPPPLGGRSVSYTAREQPVSSFLQQFFGDLDIPVTVSPGVRGTVNGAFSGRADRVYADVARAFDLATYYDGVSVYVYPSGEVGTRVFPVRSGVSARVRQTVRQLGLEDRQNKVQAGSDGVLVATGTRRFLQQVEELARAYGMTQAMAPAVEYRVFYLRYAWAEDITLNLSGRTVQIPGVASILRSLLTRDQKGVEVVARRDQYLAPVVPGLRGQGLAAQAASRQGTLGLTPANTQGAEAADPVAEDAPVGIAQAEMIMMGGADTVRVQADSRLNAVIVRDVGERMATYETLIRALDMEPALLEIEATIIDLDTQRLKELGINFRFDDGEGGVLFGNGTASDLRLFPGADSRDITPANRGLAISTVIGDADVFTSRIRALEARGAARIVSRPQVMTLSNVEAVFDNSQTFFVKLEGERDVDLFNVSTGTVLRVTPHVSREAAQNRIRMLVNIEDGALTDAQVDNLPVVKRSAINTQALIAEGQSLLVGGLTVDADANAVDQVPVLGDIPVLGNLFKTRSRSNRRTERLFLITPRLANVNAPVPVPASAPRLDHPLPPQPASVVEAAPAPSRAGRLGFPAQPVIVKAADIAPRPAPPAASPRGAVPARATAAEPAPKATRERKRRWTLRKARAVSAERAASAVQPAPAPPPAPAPRPVIAMKPIPDPEPTKTASRRRSTGPRS